MRRIFVESAAALIGACLFAGTASASPTQFAANLTPLNGSGVYAHFTLTLSGDMLTVTEHATGLEANQVHPQHIHGQLGANAPNTMVATAANDTNGDGIVSLAEGQSTYGPILVDLSSPPGGALSDFPTAPGGVINFSQTYDLTSSTIFDPGISESDLFPLTEREIVIHGMTLPTSLMNSVDGFAPGSYDPLLPVADGMIRAVPEPASALILLAGIAGCAVMRRRRGGAQIQS